MAAPSPDSLLAWLGRLHRARLIELSPRLVERCVLVLSLRTAWTREDLADSLASVLACDRETWRAIRTHFLEAHADGAPASGEPPGDASGATPEAPPGAARPPPRRNLPQWLVRLPLRGLGWAGTLLFLVVVIYFAGPEVLRWIWDILEPAVPRPDRASEVATLLGDVKPPPPSFGRDLLAAPMRTALETAIAAPPELPGPAGLRWILLLLFAPLLALLGLRWWRAVDDDRAEREDLDRRAAEARRQAQQASTQLGVPYHVELEPPFGLAEIDDAATLLARLTSGDPGSELDVPPTIDRTIAAGGQIDPVFARSGRREVLLVLVDVEDGHPYLHGVDQVLDRWRRGGLVFERLDFSWEPSALRRWPEGQPCTLDQLARRTEGRPLLVISRMLRPRDIHGQLGWQRYLGAWPLRVWLDLDPHTPAERAGDPTFARLTAAIRRFPFTAKGLVHAARFLGTDGQAAGAVPEHPLPPAPAEWLARWAACAALVPDPTWAQLDAVRRALPELRRALPDPRQVEQLVAWARRAELGGDDRRAYLLGTGDRLLLDPRRRLGLLADLRTWDRRFARDEDKLEYRARELLLLQLEAADTRGDPFGEALRRLKMAFHRAVMGREDAAALLDQFADHPGARELKLQLAEEIALQRRGHALTGAWAPEAADSLATFSSGASRALLVDLVRPRAFTLAGMLRGVVVVSLALASGGLWLAAESGLWGHLAPAGGVVATRVVETPATWKIRTGPCKYPELTALANVAPMCFSPQPAGTFTMGSPKSERDRSPNETQHPARVAAFAIGTHEVTVKQWKTVMGSSPSDCEYGCADEHPISDVSWNDACHFMIALTRRENEALRRRGAPELTPCYTEEGEGCAWMNRACTGFRLPTEAEWEYAARGGTTTAYFFGDDPGDMCKYGNGADQTAKRESPDWGDVFPCDDGFTGLAPVGKFLPTGTGRDLFDMHGNVWEWVWDWHGAYPASSDPSYAGPSSGGMRVLRGGSLGGGSWGLRAANRPGFPPTDQSPAGGFRCVRVWPQE